MNKKSNKLLINYKPVTPSRRHRIALKGEKNTPKISLLDPQIKFNKRKLIHGSPNIRGRNNQGRITTFTKGGGNQRRRRLIDHNRWINNYGTSEVISIDNNPYSTASIALLKVWNQKKTNKLFELNNPKISKKYKKEKLNKKNIKTIYDNYLSFEKKQFSSNNDQFYYITAPNNLKVGDLINGNKLSDIKGDYTEGRSLCLKDIPSGSLIHNLELTPNTGGKIARAAGTNCILIKTIEDSEGKVVSFVKLPSKKILELDANCRASIGQVSKAEHNQRVLGKAGASRWLGIRPKTRGEAKNPVDHPHGGKNHGPGGIGNQPKNRWGKLAKWTKKKKN